jgi:hypothetical protein
VRLEGLGELEKSNDLVGNRTREFMACRIVPQPSTQPRTPLQNAETEAMRASLATAGKMKEDG